MYNPDKWMIIEIKREDDPHFRVFGSWSGGYLDGDSWRMNSGITKVTEEGDFFLFHGASGSVYKCHKDAYGATAYGHGILKEFKERTEGQGIEVVSLDEDVNWFEQDWIIE